MAKHPLSALRRTAGEAKRYRVLLKLIPIVIGILATVLITVFVVSTLYSRYGAFTVTIDKFDSMKYALSLCETPDFGSGATSRLNMKAAADITNITAESLPEYLDNINGEHNGENYAAYTFYCKNVGSATIDYRYQLYIANMEQGVEKAVRVRLYVDGVATTYAHTKTDGSGAEDGTTEFRSSTVITEETISQFAPEQVTKFTIVIWLEGEDDDCLDGIIGGQFKVDMTMTVVGEAAG